MWFSADLCSMSPCFQAKSFNCWATPPDSVSLPPCSLPSPFAPSAVHVCVCCMWLCTCVCVDLCEYRHACASMGRKQLQGSVLSFHLVGDEVSCCLPLPTSTYLVHEIWGILPFLPAILGALGLRTHNVVCTIMWVLGIWAQVSALRKRVLSSLSHLPRPTVVSKYSGSLTWRLIR